MKRSQIAEMFIDEEERRKKIIFYTSFIVFLLIVIILLGYFSIKTSLTKYASYQENGTVNYKVYLKENDFFKEKYLEKDKQYIANIIDYIDANFNYNLSMNEKNVHYNYKYRIDANVNVKEKNSSKPLFTYDETIIPEKSFADNKNNIVKITDNVKIDYNKYNSLIQKFVDVYDLDNIESVLSIKMIVNVSGSGEKIVDNTNESVVSIDIPLTTKTVAIDISSNILQDNNNTIKCKSENNLFLIFTTIIMIIIEIIMIIKLLKYAINTRSVQNIYEQQLKKILNNYHSYIQKINNDFVFSDYQVLYVNEFTDLLEIRETISEPILMASDPNGKGTFFIVPSQTKILYVYSIRIKDIKRELKKLKKETGKVIKISNKKEK